MKANYKRNKNITQKDMQFIQEIADEEFNNRIHELYSECQKDIAVQFTAAVLVTLEQWYDWDKNEIRNFFDNLNVTYADLEGVGFVGRVCPRELVEHVKESLGIDLEKEILVELR